MPELQKPIRIPGEYTAAGQRFVSLIEDYVTETGGDHAIEYAFRKLHTEALAMNDRINDPTVPADVKRQLMGSLIVRGEL